jgi:chaperonin GroEL (HSP60 family)
MGYDAQEGKYVDMFAAGIIDPTKVTAIIYVISQFKSVAISGCANSDS